jgi:hypothetical protein
MNKRKLAIITGSSYLIIFFTAIYANFFVVEALRSEPLFTVQQHAFSVRLGIIAFLFTVLFDVVVAWSLYALFRENNLSLPAMLFRMMHAAIMGVALFALPLALQSTTAEEVLHYTHIFNLTWLIALFFFGVHLILLGGILGKPRWIAIFLIIAGAMYMVDTLAHILLANYAAYADIFLTLVAIPSIFGEMALALWLLFRGGRAQNEMSR